jgi:hypothetical protein
MFTIGNSKNSSYKKNGMKDKRLNFDFNKLRGLIRHYIKESMI